MFLTGEVEGAGTRLLEQQLVEHGRLLRFFPLGLGASGCHTHLVGERSILKVDAAVRSARLRLIDRLKHLLAEMFG